MHIQTLPAGWLASRWLDCLTSVFLRFVALNFRIRAIEDLRGAIKHAAERASRAKSALGLVSEDEDVLGGRPTFRGTRVPLDVVTAAPTSGAAWERLRASYPFLTEDHVTAALVYSVIRPRRGRPPKPDAADWKVKSTRRIPKGS